MKFIHLMAIVFLLLACPASADDPSCVQCHTDETILESLVTIPKIESRAEVGPAGPPAAIVPGIYHKRYLIDKSALDKDVHLANGCSFCHKGDDTSTDQEKAHKGVIKKPSADLKICGDCHSDIRETYQNAPHYTGQEMFNKVARRFSKQEEKIFADKVFGQSCKSCHASCGDCHVSVPSRNGISAGFINGHRFVKRDEGKTCAVCHGGRVYPEYTGKSGGKPDVHFQRGMSCIDCHKKEHLHGGAGSAQTNGKMVNNKPRCIDCHKLGKETKATAKLAHAKHEGRVSCYGCHSQGEYTNCYGCHIGKGSTSKSGFILGVNPDDKRTLTTLRTVPVTRETFLSSGIKMENFDRTPDYRSASVHNIQKNTERTRSCDACHVKRNNFLSKGSLIQNGSKANESLIFRMRPPSLN
jgi:hypothetical protein